MDFILDHDVYSTIKPCIPVGKGGGGAYQEGVRVE